MGQSEWTFFVGRWGWVGISKGIFSVGGGWCSFLFEGRDVWRYILGRWGWRWVDIFSGRIVLGGVCFGSVAVSGGDWGWLRVSGSKWEWITVVICFSITHFQSKNKPEPWFHYKIFHVQFLPKLIVEWKVRSFIIFLDTLFINSNYIPFLQNEKKKHSSY